MRTMQFILEDDGMEQVGLCRGMTKITVEHSEIALPEILEQFENFLRACGFHFNGNLVIEDDDYLATPLDDETEI